MIDVEKAGEYEVKTEISTNCPETQIWYYDANGNRLGTAYCDVATDETQKHSLIVIRKTAKTPDGFPRRYAQIVKKPL